MFGRKKTGLSDRIAAQVKAEREQTRKGFSRQNNRRLSDRISGQEQTNRRQRGLSLTQAGGQCDALPGESIRAYKKRMESILSIQARRELNVLYERSKGRRLW